jgi:hypothetical protein
MIKLKDILLSEGTRCWKGFEKKGTKEKYGKRVPNCVKKESKLPDEGFSDPDQMRMYEKDIDEDLRRWAKEKWTDQNGNPCGSSKSKGVVKCRPSKKVSKKTPKTWRQVDKKKEVAKKRRVGMGKRTKKAEVVTPIEEKKKKAKRDACYHKVKARYDVWPSARASQALVKCRKKGAKNWGKTTTKK